MHTESWSLCKQRGPCQQHGGYDDVDCSLLYVANDKLSSSSRTVSRELGTTSIPYSPQREASSAPHQHLAPPARPLACGGGTEGRKRRSPSTYRGKASKPSRPDGFESLFGSDTSGILASGPESPRQVMILYSPSLCSRSFFYYYYLNFKTQNAKRNTTIYQNNPFLPVCAGKVTSLTQNQFHRLNDGQLCRVTTVCDLWPHRSSTNCATQTASSQRCPPLLYRATQVASTACDIGAPELKQLAGSHMGSPPPIMECFKQKAAVHPCGRGFFRTKRGNLKKLSSEKGSRLTECSRHCE